MRLSKDILSKNYTKPRVFLCEVDKTKICQLEVADLRGSFKFNSYSEISFEVGRTYNDLISGETKVNPYFDKIEALRLIYLEGFGYFELQGPELISDGIKESKSCNAYSLEYTLSTKYLEDFYINTGEVHSQEVINAAGNNIVPVTLYNPSNPKSAVTSYKEALKHFKQISDYKDSQDYIIGCDKKIEEKSSIRFFGFYIFLKLFYD